MTSELQRLVDNLGRRLSRSVAIDDRHIRLLAYNSHAGEVDETRVESIMRRSVSGELVTYIHAQGVLDARDLFILPEQPDLGITMERIGMPVRFEGTLAGFLWLLAAEGPLTDDQADAVRQSAEQAAQILHREYLFDELRRGRERELIRDLLSGDPHLHSEAAQLLIEEELIVAGPVSVMVVTLPHDRGRPLSERDRLGLTMALDDCRRRVSPRHAVHLERADHGVLIVVHSGPSTRREVDALAEAAQRRVRDETGRPAPECWVGIGEQRESLHEVHGSYLEARRAADIARVAGVLGTVVRHSGLGVYGLLAELPEDLLRSNLHHGIQRLLDYDAGNPVLTRTLETFLDNAGDVKRTAADLNIHRASVHYRLRRIEEVIGVDLSDGNDRLALHLGLKIAQLTGLR